MRRLVIILISLYMINLCATDVSGIQTGTWSLESSPFTVIGDVTIPEGETLAIEPGVLVEFNGPFAITAEGMLEAQGTIMDTIYFDRYSTYSGYWNEIRLEQETGEGYEISYCYIRGAENGVNSIDAPLHLHHCHLDANSKGVNLFAIGNADPPDVLIENCLIENSFENAIDIYESNAVIQNNELTNNGMGDQYRGAIQVNIQSTGAVCTPTIHNNYIHHNQKQGIICTDIFSAGTINADINSNLLVSNLTGAYFYNCSGTLNDNEITDNFIPGDMNSGAGVMCYGPNATPLISNNTISGNYTALYIVNNANPCLGNSASMNPLEQGMNTFVDNIDANGNNNTIYVYNCENTYTILAENNTWDSEDFTEISATIYDHDDNPSLPAVDFDPIYMPPQNSISGTFSYNGTTVFENWYCHLNAVNHFADPYSHSVEYGSFEFEDIEPGYYYLAITGLSPGHACGTYGDYRFPEVVEITENSNIEGIEILVEDYNYTSYHYVPRTFEVEGTTVYHFVIGDMYPLEQMLLYQDGDYLKFYGAPEYTENGWEYSDFYAMGDIYMKNDHVAVGDTWTGTRQWLVNMTASVDYTVTASTYTEFPNVTYDVICIDLVYDTLHYVTEEYSASTGLISDIFFLSNLQGAIIDSTIVTPEYHSTLLPLEEGYFTERFRDTIPMHPWNLRFSGTEAGEEAFIWNNPSTYFNAEYYNFYMDGSFLAQIDAEWGAQVIYPMQFTEHTEYFVTAVNDEGVESEPSNTIEWLIPANDENFIPQTSVVMNQNYPNPFAADNSRSAFTTISFELPQNAQTELAVYNIKGEKIITLCDQLLEKGNHTCYWDGNNSQGKRAASGVYFYKLQTPKETQIKKLNLIR